MKNNKLRKILGLLVISSLLIAGLPAATKPVETIGTDKIKAGMKGYGLSVFRGTTPERFDVEVVSVIPNFLLKQDIILIRCSHPVTDKAGIIGGMSGSPIYLEGKLAGALAYGWNFNKEPLAGVTPIKNMYDILGRKLRGLGVPGKIGRAPKHAKASLGTLNTAIATSPSKASFDNLQYARTPLSIAGFNQAGIALFEELFKDSPFELMQGGGAGSATSGPEGFEPGGAIGVQLIRGDMNVTGIGTVTAIKDGNVLAFGHPMFDIGESYLPVTTATIHTVISSVMRSSKMGSPLKVVGSLIQDRKAAIVARTDKTATMIPIKVKLHDTVGGQRYTYGVEVASHRLLTARLIQISLMNMITDAVSDAVDVNTEMTARLKVTGKNPITMHDSGASRMGLAGAARYFKPVQVISGVIGNPFEDATIEWVEFDIRLDYGLDIAGISGAYITSEKPEPGENLNLHVRLRHYNAAEEMRTIPITIPSNAAGKKIIIQVGGGEFFTPLIPSPQNLDELLANYQRYYPPKSLVVDISVPEEGLSLRGKVLDRLPSSAMNALQPATGVEQLSQHRSFIRQVVPTDFLVAGKQKIMIQVGQRRNR